MKVAWTGIGCNHCKGEMTIIRIQLLLRKRCTELVCHVAVQKQPMAKLALLSLLLPRVLHQRAHHGNIKEEEYLTHGSAVTAHFCFTLGLLLICETHYSILFI